MPKQTTNTETLSSTSSPKTPTRRQHIVALSAVLVVGTILSWLWARQLLAMLGPKLETTPDVRSEERSATITPAQIYRGLDGVPVEAGRDFPFPIGVMIENLPEVRPQSGLAGASVVYEALAEGGATRFLAVIPGPGDHLTKIGPVRSVRPYYLEWLAEYGGAIDHAGGSPDALQMISAFQYPDLNGIGSAGKYHWRDRAIAAPHNLFTSSDMLTKALRDTGWAERNPQFTPWHFKDEKPLSERPSAEQFVTIKFSGYAFETEFRYRQATNTYARFNSGLPHKDALTDEQLQAKNVIVQIIPKILSIGEKGRLTLDVSGSGKALIFVDGGVNIGTWSKKDRTSRTEFFYEDGKAAELNRGTTWVEVIPEDKTVDYGTK